MLNVSKIKPVKSYPFIKTQIFCCGPIQNNPYPNLYLPSNETSPLPQTPLKPLPPQNPNKPHEATYGGSSPLKKQN